MKSVIYVVHWSCDQTLSGKNPSYFSINFKYISNSINWVLKISLSFFKWSKIFVKINFVLTPKTYSEQHGGEWCVFLGVNHGEKLWQVPLSGSNKKQPEKFNSNHLLYAFVKDLNKSKCQETNTEILCLVITNTLVFMSFII